MRILGCCALAAAALTLGVSSAHADIYTWVDKKGQTNVSNLPPPEGGADQCRPHAAQGRSPRGRCARGDAASRAVRPNTVACRLTDQVEQQRREPVAFAYAPPPMPYAPPAPAMSST